MPKIKFSEVNIGDKIMRYGRDGAYGERLGIVAFTKLSDTEVEADRSVSPSATKFTIHPDENVLIVERAKNV